MNKKYFIFITLVFGLLLSSCFKDDTNYDYKTISNIEIEGLDDNYKVYSYVEEKLELNPVLKTSYADLEYTWYMWENKESNYDPRDSDWDNAEKEIISTEQALSYEVNLKPGPYVLLLEVKSKSNNFTVSKRIDLEVSTTFLRGFYILKETAEGGSDLDLHFEDGEPLVKNILTSTEQQLLSKPLSLSVTYALGYIKGDGFDTDKTNAICVTTEDNDIYFYSTNDMQAIHDRSDVVYGGLNEEDVPYKAVTWGYSNFLLSSRGATISYTADMMGSSGAFANNVGSGGSIHAMPADLQVWGMVYFWNEEKQVIDYADGLQMSRPNGPYDSNGFSTEGMECITCGSIWSVTPNLGYFLLKDKQGKKYLYEFNQSVARTIDRIELDPSSKMANATSYATNIKTASYFYFTYNNKIYTYNVTERKEADTPIDLPGIGSDETITYLSYQWLECTPDKDLYNFTHLMVGTQKGDTYKVYMYDIVAGFPRNLVRVIEGNGKFKSIVYVSPRVAIPRDNASFGY